MSADAYDRFRRGMELLEAREFHQSVIALERAKSLEPGKASIHEGLARAYLSLRRYDRAAEEFGAVIELSPTNHYAHYCLARALTRLGDRAGAARHFKLARCLGSDLA
jgi:tetratricopeptide (TPR) repeat protein